MNIIAAIIVIALPLSVYIAQFRLRRAFLRANLPVDYASTSSANHEASGEGWRWRTPDDRIDLDLDVENTEYDSILNIPCEYGVLDYIVPALGTIGMLMVGAGALFFVAGLFANDKTPVLGVFFCVGFLAFMGFFAWLMIQVGVRLVGIELQPGLLVLHVRSSLFGERQICMEPSVALRVRGKAQSLMEMQRYQDDPHYKLFIKAPGVRGLARYYLLPFNQSQGSWIVGGLKHWNSCSQEERAGGVTAPK